MSKKQSKQSVYPNVQSAINRQGLSLAYIADASGLEIHNLCNKLYGRYELKLWEAIAIKEAIGSNLTLEVLYDRPTI